MRASPAKPSRSIRDLGFGKGLEHNLTLLQELPQFAALGSPLLVGVSRKSFIGRILGRPVDERLYGGLGLAALAVSEGARIIRTHDVGADAGCDPHGRAPSCKEYGQLTQIFRHRWRARPRRRGAR